MTGALALTVGFGDRTLQAAVTPASVTGAYNGSSASPQNISTGSVLASATGGRTPYTYAWTQPAASPDTWTISAAAAALTHFTATSIPAGSAAYADFLVTVTDAAGMTATASVSAEADNRSTA